MILHVIPASFAVLATACLIMTLVSGSYDAA
jgi:hypothetical protein